MRIRSPRIALFACLLMLPAALPGQQPTHAAMAGSRPFVMDIDWNAIYAYLISRGLTPDAANSLVKQGQAANGQPAVGCTQSPENSTLLLGMLGATGLFAGLWLRSAGHRQPLQQVEAGSL